MGAVLFCYENFLLFNKDLDFEFLGLVFFATAFIYNLHRWIGMKTVSKSNKVGRYKAIKDLSLLIKSLTVISIIAMAYYTLQLETRYLVPLGCVGAISLFYVLPVFKSKRLRDLPFIKIFLISFTWSALSLIPFLDTEASSLIWIFIEKLLFILMITLPFDIRDIYIDQEVSLATIPGAIGVRPTYTLINGIMVTLVILCVLMPFSVDYKISLILSYILTYGAIKISTHKYNDLYYAGLIDSTIILRGILVFLIS